MKDRQQKKSLDGGKKIFVISTNSITREAQNSLLKIFEEPTEGTHFFLILSSSRILIPTLKSRLHVIPSISSKGENENEKEDIAAELKELQRLTIEGNISNDNLANRLKNLSNKLNSTIENPTVPVEDSFLIILYLVLYKSKMYVNSILIFHLK